MTDAEPNCRLMLSMPPDERASHALTASLDAGDIASVVLVASGEVINPASARPLVIAGQKAGAAILIADDVRLARTLEADGVHLSAGSSEEACREARRILGTRYIVGADAGRSRDAAMRLADAGADYVAFGIPDFVADRDAARERRLDLVHWWAELFQLPCVAFDVDSPEEGEELARAGADFVALRLAVSEDAPTIRSHVSTVLNALALPR